MTADDYERLFLLMEEFVAEAQVLGRAQAHRHLQYEANALDAEQTLRSFAAIINGDE